MNIKVAAFTVSEKSINIRCLEHITYMSPCTAEPGFIPFENTVGPDQLASNEAIWSGSTLFLLLLK